jgi:hypothetical protein
MTAGKSVSTEIACAPSEAWVRLMASPPPLRSQIFRPAGPTDCDSFEFPQRLNDLVRIEEDHLFDFDEGHNPF